MYKPVPRRNFIKTAAAGTISLGIAGKSLPVGDLLNFTALRAGIIGLDTSHSVAFAKALNDPGAGPEFYGLKIVAAYPKGSSDIKSSVDRIPGYTEDVRKLGVEIVNSIEELTGKVDVVFLETNDGRLHLEQAIPVFKAGKRMFIDKPVAASLVDAIAIYEAADYYNVPVFSSSSLRYIAGVKEIADGSIGKVLGADIYSPATIEKTHPDLFWYGVHGVETLFTVMGPGCISVIRTFNDNYDKVVGTWNDGRIGTFRGIRYGKSDYGGTVFGEKAITVLGKYNGYSPLLVQIAEFFNTGIPPVSANETLEIFTFMAAAEESKLKGGKLIETEQVFSRAKKRAGNISFR
jgi:predicted dehydrogenase